METQNVEQDKKHPYFIWWDPDITEQDVRDILAGDNVYRRVTMMSYIVNDAEFDDIWKYLSIRDIQANFWQIRWRTSQFRELWKQVLTLIGYAPDECTDPIAARLDLQPESRLALRAVA